MKKCFPFISILIVLCLNVHAQTIATSLSNTAVDSGGQIYSNKQYGFSFRYPTTWIKYGKESNAINRTGGIMSVMVNFIDTVSHSNFSIEYHLAPNGAVLYNYSKAQFDSSQGEFATDAKQLEVGGNRAIESITTMSEDIKGNIINPPLKIISIRFLDEQHTGEFELHFRTSIPGSIEITRLMNVISSFEFVN